MLSVAFRRQALADLEGISNYISEFDAVAAARVLQPIHHSIYTTLATIPTAGRLNTETGARGFPVPGLPYLVVYGATDSSIDVIGVFHTARDPSEKLRP